MTDVPAEYVTSTISEAAFQRTVIEMAHALGWRVHHCRPARTARGWRTPIEGDAGFPDLVLARDGRVIFPELKTLRGRLSVAQVAWRAAIEGEWKSWPGPEGAAEYYCWRPSMLDEIEATLR